MASKYPFVPKSSRLLYPGDFWSIPLEDGTFGCGRVVLPMPSDMPGARVGFLCGVMNWRGDSAPTVEEIEGAQFLEQGIVHILAITSSGGTVLGNRALELDNLGAFTFAHGNSIQKGFEPVRKWKPSDRGKFPILSWWSYDIPLILANRHLLGGPGLDV